MKKVLFILLVATTLVACKGEDGKDGISTNWYNNSYTVQDYQWELVGAPNSANSYYYADIKVPQLTTEVFDYGAVILYLDKGTDVKNVMPYVLHKGIDYTNSSYLWTQTYDYEIEPGWIRVYVTFSDFDTYMRPDTEKFYVVMMW